MKTLQIRIGLCLSGCLCLMVLNGCDKATQGTYQGYVEGDYLYLAAPQGGYLKALDVSRGARVQEGQAVFVVAGDPDAQALEEAQARVSSAEDKVNNLKSPHREPEIAALQANLRAAEARRRLDQLQLQQQASLAGQNFVSQTKLDEAKAALEQSQAQVESVQQQIAVYRKSLGRQYEVGSALADLSAAKAMEAQKRWVLDKKSVSAPRAGEITEIYYRPGEWVPAGAAVVSLLPDEGRHLRFFVPESRLSSLKAGQGVQATCDGCTQPIPATIDFIAAAAEYTPPVIYSRGNRERLVFRVEARPVASQALQLRPGLPVDVRLLGP